MQPIEWQTAGPQPIIRPGQLNPPYDTTRAGSCNVLRVGDVYRMYYWGSGADGNHICVAECPIDKPTRWTGRGAVLAPQPDTEHNCNGPGFPWVVPMDGERWIMYFGAWGRWRADGKLPNTTGAAISDDAGRTWRYHDVHPVVANDRPWDCSGSGSCCVLRAGDELRMYYTSIGEYFDAPAGVQTGHGDRLPRIGVGYAVSRDGLSWRKPLDGLMIAPRGFDADPYEYICSKPCVIRDGDIWRMWVSTYGPAYRIRSLVSDDGLDWTWGPSGPDGEMGIGEPGSFDDRMRSYAMVVREDDEYRMWYTGNDFGLSGMGFATGPAPN